MRIDTAGIPLAFLLALVPAIPAHAQTTQQPVANIYVQGKYGVYVYGANTNGQLTPLSGSPFAETGQMEGVEGKYLITVGTDYLHSYALGSNGAVDAQAAEINTQSYSGGACGTTIGQSILDHNGQYFSVQLYGASSGSNGAGTPYINCSALQTYKIGSSGQFTFLGDSESTLGDHDGAYQQNVQTYSSNDLFVYGAESEDDGGLVFDAFVRGAAGDLVSNANFTQTGPTPAPSATDYLPTLVAADPAGHLAAVMSQPFGPDVDQYELASFTINSSTGAIVSTNTYANMPVLQGYPVAMAMSWNGSLAAVSECCVSGSGVQLFHFNGAAPATVFGSTILPNVEIAQVAFDKSNHLYLLSYSSQQLYVFTVTSSGVTEAPGSPYSIPGAYGYTGMIVVPKV